MVSVQENISLAPYTTFRVGGPARFFVATKTVEEVQEACEWAREKGVAVFVLGGGSNVLVSDKGFDGLVVKMELGRWEIRGVLVYAEAGVVTAQLAGACARAGLSGFTWAVGVPGTIGGAVRGNAGASGGEMREVVQQVSVLQSQATKQPSNLAIEDLRFKILDLSSAECKFGYRHSIFKERPELIALSATLRLTKGDPKEEVEKMKQVLNYRSATQPKEFPNSGCVFKNVTIEADKRGNQRGSDADIAPASVPLPSPSPSRGRERVGDSGAGRPTADELRAKGVPEEFLAKGRIPAGWLVEHAGGQSLTVGRARISEQHCNFLQNAGGATAEDIRTLIARVKEQVYTQFGVALHEEVQYVGF